MTENTLNKKTRNQIFSEAQFFGKDSTLGPSNTASRADKEWNQAQATDRQNKEKTITMNEHAIRNLNGSILQAAEI